ncbi:MAG: hypothetical protein NT105_06400 [Verrucomicrobia bacterium]|nr:hypothetical protein [Verrucomicrobiota bacterium]
MKHILNICFLVSFFTGIFNASPAADTNTNLFPFVLPADDITEGVTDLSFLNNKPATDPVSVRDGHFYAGGKRIRFWGVCIIGAAAFPEHEDATLIARRLASRGMNQVRIHLIDGGYAPHGLFDPEHKGELRMLPAQLEKLDFFIAELKKRGIYVELPVHGYHWRNVSGVKDYPGADLKAFAPFSSGVPLWSDRFIETEKQFARDFFGHVNPYTGKAYTEEPCVSTMEIINENGLICAWRGGHFRKVWPEAMIADLQTHWNKFLKTRYATTERVRQSWATGETHADPKDMLANRDFAGGAKSWWLQCVKPSTATMEVVPDGGPGRRPCLVLNSDRAPEKMAFVILQQPGLAIEKDCRYKLSFFAKADTQAHAPVKLSAGIAMNHAPWNSVGLASSADACPDWREVTLSFVGTQHEPAAKLMISPPVGASRVSLAGFSLRKADVIGLPPGESLDTGNVSMPLTPEDCVSRTRQVALDFVDFLYELDARYFDTMRDFLKRELRCKHPVKGTQVDHYSSYFSQARYDYLDSHGYWQHPVFPRKPWDPKDWFVGNSPMVNRGGETVVELAERRVRGKPYNVSEYCHPAPSTYCAEQVPTIASFGAMQDWDGVVFHCWQETAYDWHAREVRKLPAHRIDSWFNMARHSVKLVTMPFGALAFRRGDVAAAREETAIGVTLGEEKRWLAEKSSASWRAFDVAAGKGATWRDAFTHRLSLALGSDKVPSFLSPDLKRIQSDNGELACDLSDATAGVFTVNSPRTKAVIGFGAGRTFELGDVILKPGPTMQRGFSVITASAVRGASFHSSGASILVTATGYVENQGAVWNADNTSIGNQWGEGPVMCEGIPFEMILKTKRATAWPLDSHGQRLAPIHGETGAEGLRFAFGPHYKTLWYEIATE